MSSPEEIALRRRHLVATRALAGYEQLPPVERIELLLALAEVLPESEAEAARHAAFTLQEAEAQQRNFLGLIDGAHS